jgi:hypothetical protein
LEGEGKGWCWLWHCHPWGLVGRRGEGLVLIMALTPVRVGWKERGRVGADYGTDTRDEIEHNCCPVCTHCKRIPTCNFANFMFSHQWL